MSRRGGRFPKAVFGDGDEPDVRFSLANERTFLAWIRTSLALLAGAVAVHAPALELDEWVRIVTSVCLLAAAGVAIAQSWSRWRATERALRTGGPLPGFGGPAMLASVLSIMIIGVAVGVIIVAVH